MAGVGLGGPRGPLGAVKRLQAGGGLGLTTHNPARLATRRPPAEPGPPPDVEGVARLLTAAMDQDPELGLFLRLAVVLGAYRRPAPADRVPDVEPDALPAWAEEHAAMLLADLGLRRRHVRGVARQAQRVSQALDEDDRPYLVAAAWLHDIGYAPTLAATAFHPLDGARYLRSLGQERLARLVGYHASAQWEAEALGLADDLAAFPPEDSATADALTYCDMTTSPTGQRTTLDDRLAEIAERYGADHLVVRCLQRAHDHLAGAVERTQKRMWAVGVRD